MGSRLRILALCAALVAQQAWGQEARVDLPLLGFTGLRDTQHSPIPEMSFNGLADIDENAIQPLVFSGLRDFRETTIPELSFTGLQDDNADTISTLGFVGLRDIQSAPITEVIFSGLRDINADGISTLAFSGWGFATAETPPIVFRGWGHDEESTAGAITFHGWNDDLVENTEKIRMIGWGNNADTATVSPMVFTGLGPMVEVSEDFDDGSAGFRSSDGPSAIDASQSGALCFIDREPADNVFTLPDRFLGDWGGPDGTFEFRVYYEGTVQWPVVILLEGPAGSAVRRESLSSYNDRPFEDIFIPVADIWWEEDGYWPDIISNVTRVTITFDIKDGYDDASEGCLDDFLLRKGHHG